MHQTSSPSHLISLRAALAPWRAALLTAMAYSLFAQIGLAFFVVQPEGIAGFWPASGVLLGALLVNRRSAWPILLVAAGLTNLASNLGAGNSLPTSLGLAAANLAESTVAATALRVAFGSTLQLDRVRDLFGFVGVAVLASNAATALLGAAVVATSFGAPFATAWRIWWVADGLGIMLIVPALFAWRTSPPLAGGGRIAWRLVEGGLLLVSVVVVTQLIFVWPTRPGQLALPYPLFPLLIWSALRFGMRGATAMSVVVAGIAVFATVNSLGPFMFTGASTTQQILDVQQYLAVMALSGFVMAAVNAERGAALAALQQSHQSLEQQVAARTEALSTLNAQLRQEADAHIAAAAALRDSEAQLTGIIESAMDAIITVDGQQRITRFNPAAELLFGYEAAELLGQPLDRLLSPEQRSQHHSRVASFGAGKSTSRRMGALGTLFALRADGARFPIEAAISRLIIAEQPLYTVILRDVSLRVQAETELRQARDELEALVAQRTAELQERNSQLQASLVEKDILLREIHHRVKNNLQVITSLLRLQATTLSDSTIQGLLLESQQRVRAMALVHEKLYQSRNLAQIDFSDYVRSLSGALQRIYRVPGVLTSVQIEGVQLGVDRAMTLGLILNELISNSLKHGFPHGRGGTVAILARWAGPNLEVQVADDGIGLPDQFDPTQVTSMGFQVITTLAAQLDATLSWHPTRGAQFALSIPERGCYD